MFHQPNLAAYPLGGDNPATYPYPNSHSLLGDLVEATLARYSQYFTLPIQSLPQSQLGPKVANRMRYNALNVSAQRVPAAGCPGSMPAGCITISVAAPTAQPPLGVDITQPVTIPLTGLA